MGQLVLTGWFTARVRTKMLPATACGAVARPKPANGYRRMFGLQFDWVSSTRPLCASEVAAWGVMYRLIVRRMPSVCGLYAPAELDVPAFMDVREVTAAPPRLNI